MLFERKMSLTVTEAELLSAIHRWLEAGNNVGAKVSARLARIDLENNELTLLLSTVHGEQLVSKQLCELYPHLSELYRNKEKTNLSMYAEDAGALFSAVIKEETGVETDSFQLCEGSDGFKIIAFAKVDEGDINAKLWIEDGNAMFEAIDPKTGGKYGVVTPYSPDEHPEFDQQVGAELYAILAGLPNEEEQ